MAQKIFEQLKFFSGEFYGFAAAKNLVAAEIHFDVTESIAVLFFRNGLRAAQNGFNAD